MAKGKPIGVRFDEDKVKVIKETIKVSTHQAVVNWFLDNYEIIPPFVKKEDNKPIETKPEKKDSVNKQEVSEKIEAIKKETIPKERDTFYGRKSWKYDQEKRIEELENQIK